MAVTVTFVTPQWRIVVTEAMTMSDAGPLFTFDLAGRVTQVSFNVLVANVGEVRITQVSFNIIMPRSTQQPRITIMT